jgi:hypothetical protein
MNRIKVAPAYSSEYLQIERPSPLSDVVIEQLIEDVLSGKLDKDITDSVYTNFKYETTNWIFNSKLNQLTGFDVFDRVDIVNGCTQFIDNLYMQGPVQVLRGDYRYHERLGLAYVKDVGSLIPDIPLIIAMPFPSIGAPHHDMEEILDEAKNKRIDVHVDGAWVTCCRGVVFDLSHPSIKSVAISLSKGLGLGWNRIGLRWTRQPKPDSVTIMNDFRMNNRALAMIGLHFVRNLSPDYLWNTYGETYYKVCKDFDLTPTNSIYLALRNGEPVGVSPLIRYLAENEQSN